MIALRVTPKSAAMVLAEYPWAQRALARSNSSGVHTKAGPLNAIPRLLQKALTMRPLLLSCCAIFVEDWPFLAISVIRSSSSPQNGALRTTLAPRRRLDLTPLTENRLLNCCSNLAAMLALFHPLSERRANSVSHSGSQ